MERNIGNVLGSPYAAGQPSPQENLIEARASPSGVSGLLVGAANTVVSFSSGGVAGGVVTGGGAQ